jgi:F-type H+-transporting ATPase subunit a
MSMKAAEKELEIGTEKSHTNDSIVSQILFPHPHVPGIKAETVGYLGSLPITNSSTFLYFITLLFILFTVAVYRFKAVPGFFQSSVELLIVSIENLLKSLTGGKEHRVKELLYPISAVFLIIGTINIIGSFPILPQILFSEGEGYVHLFRKSTADINTTLGLAIVIVISMQFFGIKENGFFGYFSRFIPLKHLWNESKKGLGGFFLGIIELFVGLLELVSEAVKVVSLSLRLFGNMFAGEILLAILTGIFAIGLPALWLGFDFLVAIIQTIVIGCLTAVYYTLVVKEKGAKEGY